MAKKKTMKCPDCGKKIEARPGPMKGVVVYECSKCRYKVIRRG